MAKTPAKHRQSWSKADVAALRKMAKKRPAGIVAHELGRSVAAIRGKAASEGISFGRPERSPYGRPVRTRPAGRK
jgi:hypothetical protein